jgi:hypothetical protein
VAHRAAWSVGARKSPAERGFAEVRRRGLEPPPGYPGPGPQPGNPAVRCVHSVPDRPLHPRFWTIWTHRTIWMLPRMLPRAWGCRRTAAGVTWWTTFVRVLPFAQSESAGRCPDGRRPSSGAYASVAPTTTGAALLRVVRSERSPPRARDDRIQGKATCAGPGPAGRRPAAVLARPRPQARTVRRPIVIAVRRPRRHTPRPQAHRRLVARGGPPAQNRIVTRRRLAVLLLAFALVAGCGGGAARRPRRYGRRRLRRSSVCPARW